MREILAKLTPKLGITDYLRSGKVQLSRHSGASVAQLRTYRTTTALVLRT